MHTSGYGGQRLNHVKDLALVEMDSEVDLTASTLPACIDWGLEERPLRAGDVGTVSSSRSESALNQSTTFCGATKRFSTDSKDY